MLEFHKYGDIFEKWGWSINDDYASYDEIHKNAHNADINISIFGEVEEWHFKTDDNINFNVSMSVGIKYAKQLNKPGWLISGSLYAECIDYVNEYVDTDEECSYPDMTVYSTFQEALNNLNLPIDYFFKRLNYRSELINNNAQ